MRKILINEKQEKYINEIMQHNDALLTLPAHLLKDINYGNTSLSDFDFFNTSIGKRYLEKILIERFNEVKAYFSDDIKNISVDEISNKINKITNICIKKEEKIRPQLEKLCYNILTELFDIPEDSFDFECHLVEEIDNDKTFNVFPEPDNLDSDIESDTIDNLSLEIQKRRLINSICVGGSMIISDKCKEIYLHKIFEFDEELPHLYSKLLKLNELYLFLTRIKITDKFHQMGGYVEVTLPTENSIAKINANAVLFPILLAQSIQGLMEIFSSYGLPDNNEEMLKITNVTDVLSYEPWDMRIGPKLFNLLFNNIEELDTKDLPYIFTDIVKLNSNEFLSLMKETIEGTNKSYEIVNQIKDKSLHDKKYNDFENDLLKKQNDKDLVVDDINENEMDEANYPQSFDMETFKNLPSFSQRIKYCENNLKRIASGSSRIVYIVDNNTVLKLAKNKKGIAQNEVEGQSDYYRSGIGLFADVYDIDDNYLWIEMQYARKAKPSDFKRITGYDFKMIQEFVEYLRSNNWIKKPYDEYWKIFDTQEFWDKAYDEDNIFHKLEDYIKNYGLEHCCGDLQRISSWGIVNNNGEEELVLVDYGIDENVMHQYYK